MKVFGLKCEDRKDPMGVDVSAPRFSWQADVREQRGWQIRLWEDGGKCLWDSGKVISDCPRAVYAGAPLQGGRRYFWQVRIWDGQDKESRFSNPARLDTGKMDMPWRGKWICAGAGDAPIFRHDFRIDGEVREAWVFLCALGCGEMYINGHRVGSSVLDPAFTDYTRRVLYTVHRVEKWLRRGRNTLSVMAGNGWFGNGHPFLGGLTREWLDTPRIRLDMDLLFADGHRETRDSAENWKTAPSPILRNNLYDGETYDARQEMPDFARPAGETDGRWQPVAVGKGPAGRPVCQEMEPMEITHSQRIENRRNPAPGIWVYDMGRNMAGWVKIRVCGEAGQKITLRYAEVLDREGFADQRNLMQAAAMDEYICRGGGEEEYEPRFTYHGFRYVQVEGGSEGLQMWSRQVRSHVGVRGHFACGEEMLEQIQACVLQTELSNVHGIPTDCPQRSERMGWLNDMTARCEEMVYNLDCAPLLRKWVDDIFDTQDPESGTIRDTAPALFSKWLEGDPVDSCCILIPWLLYVHYGDTDTLKKHYGHMKQWFLHLQGRSRGDILSAGATALGDWASPEKWLVGKDNPRSAITPEPLVSTAYYYYDAVLLEKIAGVLGKKQEQAVFARRKAEIAQAFRLTFFDPVSGKWGTGSQGCHAIALYMGLVPPEEKARATAWLARDVEAQGWHLTTGNLCTKYLMEVLCDGGYVEHAYRLAVQRSYPGWGYMLDNGATTIWERWENAVGGGMNSHNHPMYGSVSAWFFRYLAGIRVGERPGEWMIAPVFPEKLAWAEGSLDTPAGLIRVRWERQETAIRLEVQCPFASQVHLCLPAEMVAVTTVKQYPPAPGCARPQ